MRQGRGSKDGGVHRYNDNAPLVLWWISIILCNALVYYLILADVGHYSSIPILHISSQFHKYFIFSSKTSTNIFVCYILIRVGIYFSTFLRNQFYSFFWVISVRYHCLKICTNNHRKCNYFNQYHKHITRFCTNFNYSSHILIKFNYFPAFFCTIYRYHRYFNYSSHIWIIFRISLEIFHTKFNYFSHIQIHKHFI